MVNVTSALVAAGDYAADNPLQAVAIGAALAVSLVATGPVLGLMGFTPIGPAAGSAAAAFQSSFGAVGAFPVLQSAAMGGAAGTAQLGAALGLTQAGLVTVVVGDATVKAMSGDEEKK